MQTTENLGKTATYQVQHYGPMDDWGSFVYPHARLGNVPGKQFLRRDLGLTGMELSLNSLAPGKAIPFLHGHKQNEELYLFLSGKGQMVLDGEVVEVSAGSAVRVATPVLRAFRNTGDVPLVCIVIQSKEGSLSQATSADGFVADAPPAWPA